jgi:hypothetical protein
MEEIKEGIKLAVISNLTIQEMKKIRISILIIILGIEIFFLLSLIIPKFYGVQYNYFDLKTGCIRIDIVSFGYIQSSELRETAFSKMVEKMGITSIQHDWQQCYQENVGIKALLKFFRGANYEYSSLRSECNQYSGTIDLAELSAEEKKAKTIEFLKHLSRKNLDALKQCNKDLARSAHLRQTSIN